MSTTYEELNIKVTTMFENLAMLVSGNLETKIQSMSQSGMTTKEVRRILLTDLIGGGRLFGQLRNGVKRISKNSIEEAGNIASIKRFMNEGIQEYKWITVGVNICPDCRLRHGDTGTLNYFKAIGMPKSGFSICEHNCNCLLVPVNYKGENLEKPIKHTKSNEGRK